ncbi:flagellar basal body rod protein FlgB [Telmatospirillum sp.]|uniref:flagellar basal body rod protein FlgB n=1 Tax=Telmatospirillum sp. TaxID=2079197 RepID=UPI0028521DFF|nr:flagellar basal body rod protein FlgB [Telmatospirillum sp.]MDR3438518.1 flagellar basal body rod protein FlgB [Telmatospirillum sp.]
MFEDLTLFAMAQKSMDWLSKRQEVLSENVANANTTGYQAKDLAPISFKHMLEKDVAVRAATTNPMHVSPEVEPVKFETVTERSPDESKPNGNSVLIEEQMQKIGEVKGSYELAANLFTKHLTMLKTAIGKGS